jgi:hypothetical protein
MCAGSVDGVKIIVPAPEAEAPGGMDNRRRAIQRVRHGVRVKHVAAHERHIRIRVQPEMGFGVADQRSHSVATAAKRWQELSHAVVHERARRAQALDKRLRRAFEERFIGTRTSVLFESVRDSHTGRLKGTSSNYLRITCDADDRYVNRIVDVRITGRAGKYLEGVLA